MLSATEEFSDLDSIHYFDNAALGITPSSVRQSTSEMMNIRMARGTAVERELTRDHIISNAQAVVRELLGIQPGKTFVASNAMGTVETILRALPRLRGNMVCAMHEFPGLIEVAQRLAHGAALDLRLVESRGGEPPNLLPHIDDETSVVLVSQVHWLTGRITELDALEEAKSKHGFVLVVDASQSLPVVPINLEPASVDVLVAAGYKWLAGGLGSAVVHISSRLQDELSEGLGASLRPVIPSTQSYIAVHNLAASIAWMQRYGMDIVRRDTIRAAQMIKDLGTKAGWTPLGGAGEQRSGIVSFSFPQDKAEHVAEKARAMGLYLSARGAAIRLSPHFTVSTDRCREAIGILKRIVSE